MMDILKLALSQRDELCGEIAKLDGFIRTAKTLSEMSAPAEKRTSPPVFAGEGTAVEETPPTDESDALPSPRPWARPEAEQERDVPGGESAKPARSNLLRR